MTKEKFQEAIVSLADPHGDLGSSYEHNMRVAAEFRPFDPKLADIIEAGANKWREAYLYVKSRAER